jgi:hypothetical protein
MWGLRRLHQVYGVDTLPPLDDLRRQAWYAEEGDFSQLAG